MPNQPITKRTKQNGNVPNQKGSPRDLLTVAEFCREFKVPRSTLYDWIAKRIAPKYSKLPNGQLRFDRHDVDAWFSTCEVAA